MGRSDHRDYARYHEVLNRAVWSPRQAARILLALLLDHQDRGLPQPAGQAVDLDTVLQQGVKETVA